MITRTSVSQHSPRHNAVAVLKADVSFGRQQAAPLSSHKVFIISAARGNPKESSFFSLSAALQPINTLETSFMTVKNPPSILRLSAALYVVMRHDLYTPFLANLVLHFTHPKVIMSQQPLIIAITSSKQHNITNKQCRKTSNKSIICIVSNAL